VHARRRRRWRFGLEISELQRIGGDEWVRSVDEVRPCQSGSWSSASGTAGQGTASSTSSAAAASVTDAASADALGDGRQRMRAASTGKLHAVARADQPAPHRQADVPCTEDSDLHCFS
jgi:hypothetical protein